MNRLKNSLLLLSAVLCALSLQADFTHVSVWERIPASGEKQLLVMCGDDHALKNTGLQQAEEIVALLKTGEHNQLIIEDALDYTRSIGLLAELQDGTENHEQLMRDFQDFQTNTLNAYRRQDVVDHEISGIVLVPELATKHGIPCKNVEFRQLITFQLPSLLELIDKYGYDHCVIIKTLIDRMCHEIESFNDIPALNLFYKQVLSQFAPVRKTIDLFMGHERHISKFPEYLCDMIMNDPSSFDVDALTYHNPSQPELVATREEIRALQKALIADKHAVEKKELLEHIELNFVYCTFSSLIDAYMLHALYEHQIAVQHENIVVICAGLDHTKHLEQFLKEQGYALLDECFDEKGVNVADFCTPFTVQKASNPIVYAWSYIADAVGSMVGYVTKLFA